MPGAKSAISDCIVLLLLSVHFWMMQLVKSTGPALANQRIPLIAGPTSMAATRYR